MTAREVVFNLCAQDLAEDAEQEVSSVSISCFWFPVLGSPEQPIHLHFSLL